MKTASCKAKGRRACSEVKELLCKYAPDLDPDHIAVTPSGCTGDDLFLSPAAREIYPWAIECKNTEAINVWKAFAQAEGHAEIHRLTGRQMTPVLFFRRNRSKLMVCLEAENFLEMIR